MLPFHVSLRLTCKSPCPSCPLHGCSATQSIAPIVLGVHFTDVSLLPFDMSRIGAVNSPNEATFDTPPPECRPVSVTILKDEFHLIYILLSIYPPSPGCRISSQRQLIPRSVITLPAVLSAVKHQCCSQFLAALPLSPVNLRGVQVFLVQS